MRSGLRILSILAGLILFMAAVLTTAWNTGATQSDWGLPTLVPDEPDIALGAAVTEFRTSGRMPSQSTLLKAKSAARLDPLEEEQLLLAALAQTDNGPEQTITLLEEARRRNPASSEVRLVLLDRFLRQDNMAGTIGEVGALAALLPEDGRKQLSQLLLSLVAAPETRHEAVAALQQSPMRKELISELARAGASSFLLLDLSKDLTSLKPDSPEAQWSQSVTQALVDQGDLDGAKRLWSHYFSIPSAEVGARVFDETFQGTAAPPFGWQLTSHPGGIAELEGDGLRVRYESRETATFARALLLLKPGRYRLDYNRAPAEGQSPNLDWRVDCLNNGGTILDLSLEQSYSFEAEQSNEFTVPAQACPGQWLTLVGRSLPVPSMRTALFTSVRIAPVSSK